MINSFMSLSERLCGRKLVIYGIGLIGLEALMILERVGGFQVEFFVDRRANTNNTAFGKTVQSKEILSPKEHYCIVSPPNFYEQISKGLESIGFVEHRDYCSYGMLRGDDVVYEGVPIGKHTNGFFAFTDCLGYGTKNYISSIGRFCSINKSATIGADHKFLLSTSHEVFRINKDTQKKFPEAAGIHSHQVAIGNDVWIGAGVFINASKVQRIGDGAVIATSAVVISDVPPYSIVAGVPAKVKKYRFTPEEIDILLRVKWWEWSDEEIASNIDLFVDYSLFFNKYK